VPLGNDAILAAAGIHALTNNVVRLAEDHARAERLAAVLARFPELGAGPARTNMVFLSPESLDVAGFIAFMAGQGIAVGGGYGSVRWVTHLDVDDRAVEAVGRACEAFFTQPG